MFMSQFKNVIFSKTILWLMQLIRWNKPETNSIITTVWKKNNCIYNGFYKTVRKHESYMTKETTLLCFK